jgi:RimJ/RimL family protein N-acetyltransferase
MEYAREHGGLTDIRAAVDEPNVASVRVLEKLGFTRTGHVPGAFGKTWTYCSFAHPIG